jgi:hypothetical protein
MDLTSLPGCTEYIKNEQLQVISKILVGPEAQSLAIDAIRNNG